MRKKPIQGKLMRVIPEKLKKQRTGKIYLKIRIIKEAMIYLNIELMIIKISMLVVLEGTNKYWQTMKIFSKIIKVKSVTVAWNMKMQRKGKFMKILREMNNWTKELNLKILIINKAIMMILIEEKLIELKKLNDY